MYLNFSSAEVRESVKYLNKNWEMFSCDLSVALQAQSYYEELRVTIADEDKDLQEYLQAIYKGQLPVSIQFDLLNLLTGTTSDQHHLGTRLTTLS